MEGPVLLHVLTDKGHGFEPAVKDPVKFHAPAPFQQAGDGIIPLKTSSSRAYTDAVSDALFEACSRDPKVAVITAAMCEGNKLQQIRETFPDQFFDVGICESHAVAFAAGMAKAGARPVVDIYSTFLQRSYDQIFQEVALQDLPVVFCLDRAGLVGADGPTHHGTYDLAYLRVFPNMVVMAPGDEKDIAPMFDFALAHDAPVAMRYPKRQPRHRSSATSSRSSWARPRSSSGRPTGCSWPAGRWWAPACASPSGCAIIYGLRVGVVNARFVKPLDRETIGKAIEECGFVLTVEEGCLMGGFGSAVLEAANDAGLPTTHIRRLGLPDRYVMHAERDEQLAEVGLDVEGVTRAALSLARSVGLAIPDLAKAKGSNGPASPAGTERGVLAGKPAASAL